MLYSFTTYGQQNAVTGKVLGEDGSEPLPGVAVMVKGTNLGTVTDINGDFTVNAGPKDVLVFSFVGFATQEVPVGTQTSINITLSEDITALEEVVVIGYGSQNKESVTGSVVSLGGAEVREVPTGNVTSALQGRMAGVEMTQTSSKPGASMQIRIRGVRSLSGENDPLIVLDGVPFAGSLSDLDPNSIKSVDILKDASATAIYGSRGANGVILVTTNKGRQGQKARFTYDSFYGIKTLFAPYPMMDGPQFVALRKARGQFSNGIDEVDDVNTDWQDKFYKNSSVQSHNVGVSGGTENGNYSFGIGYLDDKAIIPEQNYKRYSMRASLDQYLGKYFRVGFSSNNNYSITNGANLGLYSVLSASPIADPYNEDGSEKRVISMAQDDQWVYTRNSIKGLGDGWIDQNKVFGSYNNVYGEVSIPGVEGLKYRANLGLNYRSSNSGSYTGRGVFNVNEATVSTASIGSSTTTSWVIENLLTYDKTFGSKHNINLTALYSAQEDSYNSSLVSARDVPSDALQYYNLGQATGQITIDPNSQNYTVWGLQSYMGRAMYSYDEKYMLTATFRADGSSRLAPGHKWHAYPAVSAGWNISEENFMSNVGLINNLKLRVGYGQTSNQAIAPYSTLGRLSTRPYNFGPDNYDVGYYLTEVSNDELGWEFSQTWNYALEFALLNNRLSGTLEYYTSKTSDVLNSVNLPITSGVNTVNANVGAIENKGLELALNGVILDNANGWTWEAGLNIYGNRNKITELSSGTDRDEANWWFVGHPVNVIYDYNKIGLWQAGDAYQDILEPGPFDAKTRDTILGSIKVEYTGEYDSEGKPVRAIGPDDRKIIDVNPKFQGGFNTRVSYKGFDLSVIAAFQKGGTLISTLYSSSGYLNMLSGRRNNVDVDYWTPENTDADFPNPLAVKSGDNPKYGSTLGYFDASYFKIRTISLGYNFQQDWVKNAGIERLRLYFTVQNALVMFSPYHRESGMDPETNSYGDENAATTDAYQKRLLTIGTNTPSTRNFTLGLNLTF
ncbi:SusC/RagA family TonB-linked outer membrane protein [Fulvivirga sediminis]|nr:TonB-dependent receptor [Fulvivirga sediminis]